MVFPFRSCSLLAGPASITTTQRYMNAPASSLAESMLSARVVVVGRPGVGQLGDRRFGRVHFVAERSRGGTAAFCIPTRRRFRFFESFLEIFKFAGHVRLPRGCADVLPTTKLSWRYPRRRVRAAPESRQTMWPPRRGPLLNRDSVSARRQARLAPHRRVEGLLPRAVWNP